jgi:uncharacterized protein YbaR (Trm112 family)
MTLGESWAPTVNVGHSHGTLCNGKGQANKMLEDILICPKTKNRIAIDAVNSIAKVEQSDLSYPVKAGIVDLLPDAVDRISEAYDSLASSYDDYQTLSRALVHESNIKRNALTENRFNKSCTILAYLFPASYSKLNNPSRFHVSELHHAWISVALQ